MTRFTRALATAVALSVSYAGMVGSAQATLVSTEQIAEAQQVLPVEDGRARLNAVLDRADVQQALQDHGVTAEQARERVAALTDAEAAQVAAQIDAAPAGASDVLGAIVFIFVLLLVTDILGLTKVFPFTRSVR